MAFTTVMAQTTLQPGTYDSPVQKVASTINQIWLRGILDAAALTDSTKSVSVVVFKSKDGVTWPANPAVQLDWTGYPGNTRPPGFVIDGPAGGPAFWVRGRLVVKNAINLGLEMQLS